MEASFPDSGQPADTPRNSVEPTKAVMAESGSETPRGQDDVPALAVQIGCDDSPSDHEDQSAATPTTQHSFFGTATSSSPTPTPQPPPQTVVAHDSGYCSPRPVHYNTAQLSIPEDAELPAFPSPSPNSQHPPSSRSPHSLLAPSAEHASQSPNTQERPTVQRDYSTSSTLSNASTVRAAEFNNYLHLSQSRSQEPEPYPNQAFSVLHNQHYYVNPSFARSRSTNPLPYTVHASHSQASSPGLDEGRPSDRLAVPSSTASSPGLYTAPRLAGDRTVLPQPGSDGTYASPYLHHTHRQMPKETHLAEIDFDPISGRKVINQYEVIDELGRGVHGKVKLGRNLTDGTYVAIKIVERYSKRKRLGKNNSHEAKIKKEIAILKKVRHPNIVGLLEVIDDPMSKKVYIILEHVEMGEVQWRTEGAPEISLLQYRRCQREQSNKTEDEDEQARDKVIMDEALKHVEKVDRRNLRALKRMRAAGADIASWSLEYGDDDDDEYSNSNVSRVASSTTPLSRQHYDPDYPRPDQTVLHYEDTSSQSLRAAADIATSESSHQLSSLEAALEGSMYGSYENDSYRGRAPSVAGSASSTTFEREHFEQIPENYRHVPLLTLPQACRAFRDTLLGLEYLHYQGVVHRDIKPANLLQAADHHIKISDFGVSYLGKEKSDPFPTGDEASEVDDQDHDEAVELAKTVGTPAFYAPELCQTDVDSSVEAPPVTHQIDIWALGVTLFCLVFGRVPFYDANTFHLMRLIADEEVFIPRERLKAVHPRPGSRPSSHNRTWSSSVGTDYRQQHELAYEEVDEELLDLLKRMLTKDPRKRITLKEVKYHGWTVRGIKEKVLWLEETDPNNFTAGRRIEISKEDVEVAVVPITIVERAKSVARKVGEVFGISSKKSSSRRRAESSATNTSDRSQPASAASSSSTISQDAKRQLDRRRPSLKPDESIFSALKASRDAEHPLSHSVSASPEATSQPTFFPGPDSGPGSPMSTVSQSQNFKLKARPAQLDRTHTAVPSTSASIKTIRPGHLGLSTGAATLPALPSTPLEVTAPSNLSSLFGGTKQKLLSSIKSTRDRSIGRYGRSSPIERSYDDPHAQASLGISDAVAAGQVNAPHYLLEGSTTSSSVNSTSSSRAPSISSRTQLEPGWTVEAGLSRPTSSSSFRRARARTDASTHPQSTYLPLLGDDNLAFDKAKEQQIRRSIQESATNASGGRHQSEHDVVNVEDCPPSPDDMIAWRKEQENSFNQTDSYFGNIRVAPDSHYHLVSSSSEDQFTGMSQSTSNPSIPSVASASSSVPADDGMHLADQAYSPPSEDDEDTDGGLFLSKDQRAVYSRQTNHEDFAYDGDHAVESDEDSDSDDSFVEMTRKKSRVQGLSRSESVSNGELALHRARRATGETHHGSKSERSGSSNTMKKVTSHGDSEDENDKQRPLSAVS